MRTASDPNHPGKDWYQELCALAAIGELSSSEFDELRQHLAECGDCRQTFEDFRRVSGCDLGLVAALKQSERDVDEGEAIVDEAAVLVRLLDRATRERANCENASAAEPAKPRSGRVHDRFVSWVHWLRRPSLSYGTVGLILCAMAALGVYRFRETQPLPRRQPDNHEVSELKKRADTIAVQERAATRSLEEAQSDRERLRKALAEAEAAYTTLEAERRSLQTELASERMQLDQNGRALEAARVNSDEKNKEVAQLETRLQNAVQRTEEERRVADDLESKLQLAEQQAASTTETQGFGDAEAKALFGARDLHIVDVYDVDTEGHTRRTYGRVYYVEKQLLIFYAFDLQDKKHNRAAAGFQAWGYRQPSDRKPDSLGLFDLDDPTANRWVLKVNNPRVLERIDAVFVTLEPPSGSPSPRGRRLLYANLAGPANHP
jgi:hypothetical protein